MLLYPKTIESKLGFDKIISLIEAACNCPLGRNLVAKIQVLDDYQIIGQLLKATDEIKKQIQSGEPFPEIQAFDLQTELERSAIKGYFMPEEALFRLKLNISIMLQIGGYFKKNSADYPSWSTESGKITVQKDLWDKLDQVFDRDGSIKDNASNALRKIRQDIRLKESKARKELDAILKAAAEKGYTEKDCGLTIRDGRLVIPIQAEHKRRIKGLIVDESTTGKTVFLEPLEVFDRNNEIRELRFAEIREIIAILTVLTSMVALEKHQLLQLERFLGQIDFARAKAKIAIQLGACKPTFTNTSDFRLINAVHPLLLLTNRKLGLPVVPLDIEVNREQRIIVISGPNAGGKSVTIKTVGLLQLMLQAGMLVPVAEESVMGCFRDIFVDIGDEQSIENDLSTYSSHLVNMNYLLKNSTQGSLFLIDEFGAGTEPQFGGAIAESILRVLVLKKARGLITTHYGNLKKFAEENPCIENAAMRFDLEKLVPRYKLDVGRPGSSFALEIAAKIGLPEEVIQDAKNKIGHDPVAFEKLVSELEQEKQKYDEYNKENQRLRNELEKQISSYDQQLSELQQQRKEIINDAKLEARNLLTEANQKIEATIRSIQEHKADKVQTQKVRRELNEFREKTRPAKIKRPESAKVIPGPIKKGDIVRLKNSEARGEVINVSGKSAEILMGALKSKVNLNRLEKIGKATREAPGKINSNIDLHRKRATYSTQLDVRGFRAKDAIKAVVDFIDEGMLLGMNDLRILHGKGDGILRKVIREQLMNDPAITSIRDEHVERGGAGVTVITLK